MQRCPLPNARHRQSLLVIKAAQKPGRQYNLKDAADRLTPGAAGGGRQPGLFAPVRNVVGVSNVVQSDRKAKVVDKVPEKPPVHAPRRGQSSGQAEKEQDARRENPQLRERQLRSMGLLEASRSVDVGALQDQGNQQSEGSLIFIERFNSSQRWEYHKSTGRYWRHLSTLFTSATFVSLQKPLSLLTLNAGLVVVYQELVDSNLVPNFMPDVHFTDIPFELTSFALALLLVFRTDTSYERWNTGLTAWIELRNASNQFMREVVTWIKDPVTQRKLVRWTVAFSRALMLYSRQQPDVRGELTDVLYAYELKQLQAARPYYPQFTLQVLTAIIEKSKLSEYREDKMLKSLNVFYEAVGTCERIIRYPIPLVYTRHTSRFMILWLIFLPMALYDDCNYAVIPVTTIISFLLLGIDEIGVQVEEPFSKLPLEDICQDISIDLYNTLANTYEVERLADPAQDYRLQQEE